MPSLRHAAAALLGLAMLFAPSARAVDLALQNGWSVTPSGAGPARAFLDGGIVSLRGAIAGGSTGLAFNLPAELRPQTDVYVAVALCNATQGRLWIQPSGNVSVQAKPGGFADAQCRTSLDGATFAPVASGYSVLTLANGWTHAPYSTSSASAALLDGVVRLKGAIAQGSSGLAFTLPPELRPTTSVYVPIGLCNANKGRLIILPSGTVSIQAETSFAEAQCFTSLDGAWFAPNPAGFTTLALVDGWSHAPFSTSDVAAVLTGGVVRFKGAMANGTFPTAFTLPPALRPQSQVDLPIDLCSARTGRLSIAPTGSVVVEAATAFSDAQCFTSLDGVSFLPTPNGLAKLPLPVEDGNVVFADGADRTYTIDLGTLPVRPGLVVEVRPPETHPDMQLQIEATSWVPPSGYTFLCASSIFSPPSTGTARLSIDVYRCASGPTNWANGEADIRVRVLDFGAAGPPATVAVVIRGETRPPTGTLVQNVDPPFVTQTVSLVASKDSVLYGDLLDGNDGRGQFLWAGRKTTSIFSSFARNALIAFDLESVVPPSAVVQSATLSLAVTGIVPFDSTQRLAISRVAPNAVTSWQEGFLDAAGSEFDGAPGSASGVDWLYRDRTLGAWTSPGGDRLGPPIVDTNLSTPGAVSFSPVELTSAVQSMVSTGTGADGFLLEGSPQSIFSPATQGIQLASRENPGASPPPTLVVDYYPTEVYQSGEINAGTISFIDAAQNFRWIYDTDQDGVYVTPEIGICEVTDPDPFNPNLLPYTYRFQGTPGFTGVDCCTWRVSSGLGIVGTGQALFFHNLDAGNPTNQPPDTDRDGIRDLCDNCPYYANGPLLGACLSGATVGRPCRSNVQCGSGGVCSLSQEDADGDFIGNVCVPEPGFSAGLAAGLLALMALAARPASARASAPAIRTASSIAGG
ncbi:MAG: hypothetical protein IPK00_05650 [Deltaproteobacteria bacterium]|nr:hypothetical protein [Deltaproteobacteria bacterium]